MPLFVNQHPMPARSLLKRRSGGRAFTMIEILLAIGVMVLLAGAVTYTMFGRVQEHYLDEGSQRFETVLRMARAEAANQGRRLRLSWIEQEQRLVVLWEPEPLAQPGQFVELTSASWAGTLPSDLIRIVSASREGESESQTGFGKASSAMAGDDEAATTTLIDFYPDGSCDTATFELASRDESDLRRALVEFDGFNYLISTRIMDADELAAWYAAQLSAAAGNQ